MRLRGVDEARYTELLVLRGTPKGVRLEKRIRIQGVDEGRYTELLVVRAPLKGCGYGKRMGGCGYTKRDDVFEG